MTTGQPEEETQPLVQAGEAASCRQKVVDAGRRWFAAPAARLCFFGLGIIGLLGLYGFQQERIMSIPYGTGAYFTDSVFLVLNNRIIAAMFAIGMVSLNGERFKNGPPLWKYAVISLSNVAATSCQYEALKYVSFPVQMLGKSAKMVPVMVWGMLITCNFRKYKLLDWFIALAVTGGCMMFLMTGDISSKRAGQGDSFWGLVLMCGYLLSDGFTSMFQEKLFKDHRTTTYNQMLYINLCSAVMSLIILVATQSLIPSLNFAYMYPELLADSTILSLSATGGQLCIYNTIKDFGAVVFAAIMNVRQVISITISLVWYGHAVTLLQIVGMLIVFLALFLKAYASHRTRQKKRDELQAKSAKV